MMADEARAGREHAEGARALRDLARLLNRRGHTDEARTLRERAPAIQRRLPGPDERHMAAALIEESRAAFAAGDPAGSEALLLCSRAVLEGLLGFPAGRLPADFPARVSSGPGG